MSWADFSLVQLSLEDWVGVLVGLTAIVVLAAMLAAEVDRG